MTKRAVWLSHQIIFDSNDICHTILEIVFLDHRNLCHLEIVKALVIGDSPVKVCEWKVCRVAKLGPILVSAQLVSSVKWFAFKNICGFI